MLTHPAGRKRVPERSSVIPHRVHVCVNWFSEEGWVLTAGAPPNWGKTGCWLLYLSQNIQYCFWLFFFSCNSVQNWKPECETPAKALFASSVLKRLLLSCQMSWLGLQLTIKNIMVYKMWKSCEIWSHIKLFGPTNNLSIDPIIISTEVLTTAKQVASFWST